MENKKAAKLLIMLIKLFGILSIIGLFLEKKFITQMNIQMYLFKYGNTSIILISPLRIIAMLILISVYLLFINKFIRRFVSKDI